MGYEDDEHQELHENVVRCLKHQFGVSMVLEIRLLCRMALTMKTIPVPKSIAIHTDLLCR